MDPHSEETYPSSPWRRVSDNGMESYRFTTLKFRDPFTGKIR